ALLFLATAAGTASAETDIGVTAMTTAFVTPGGSTNYWITIANTGAAAATNVTLTANFPPHMRFVTLSFDGLTSWTFTLATNTLTAKITSLAGFATATPVLSVSFDASTPATPIDLSFTVTSVDDTTPANNAFTARSKVVGGASTIGVFRNSNGAWYLNNQNDSSAPEFAF